MSVVAGGARGRRIAVWLAGPAPGAVLAGYRLEARIGAGGMAVVFRAVDERLGRTVALKVLAPGLAGDGEFRERFVRESRAAATVDHPHIGTVSDPGGAGVRSLAINVMGTQLAVADKNGTTYVWNLPSLPGGSLTGVSGCVM